MKERFSSQPNIKKAISFSIFFTIFLIQAIFIAIGETRAIEGFYIENISLQQLPILSSFGSDSLAYFMTSQLSPPSIRIWGCTGAQVNDSWVLNQSTIAGDIAFENGKLYLAYLKQGNGYNTLTLAVNSASGWNSTALYTLSDSGIPPVALAVSAGEYHILTQDGIYLLYFNRSHFEKSSIAYMNGSGGADIALDEGKAVFAFIYNDRIAFANEYRYYENEGRAIYEYTPHIIDSENYTSGTAVKFFIPQRGPDTGKWVVIYSTSYTFPTTLIAKSSDKGQTWEIKSIGGGTLLDAAVDSEGKYHIIVRQSTRALVYFTPNSIAGWDMYNLGDYNENNGAGIAVTSSGEVHILFNTYNSSSYYNYFSHAVKGSPPVPVSSLNAMPLSKRVVLSWNDTQNENVLGYSIYRGTSASTLTLIANVSNNTHTYNDTDVSNEVQYYYSVKAYNLFGDSDYSQVVSAVPSAAYGKPPLSPRNLTALQKAYKGVVLQWEPPVWDGGADITSYNIYRGESPDSLSYFSNTTSLTYPDTTAAGNRYYYYMVKAVNQFGEGNGTEVVRAWSVPDITQLEIEVEPDRFFVDSEAKKSVVDVKVWVYGIGENRMREKVVNARVEIGIAGSGLVYNGTTGSDGSYTFRGFEIDGSYLNSDISIKASINEAQTSINKKVEKTPTSSLLGKKIFTLRYFLITLTLGFIIIPLSAKKYQSVRTEKIRAMEKKEESYDDQMRKAQDALYNKFMQPDAKKESVDLAPVEPETAFKKWKQGLRQIKEEYGVISPELIDKSVLKSHLFGYNLRCSAEEERVLESGFEFRIAPDVSKVQAENIRKDKIKEGFDRVEVIIENSRKDGCTACNSKKRVICPKCASKKKITCTNCDGKTTVLCVKCQGNGYIKVPVDNHLIMPTVKDKGIVNHTYYSSYRIEKIGGINRKIYTGLKSESYRDYDIIYETKTYTNYVQQACPVCKGTRKVPCKTCDSTGTITCTQCKGSGDIICSDCNGHGEQIIYSGVEKKYKTYRFNKDYASFEKEQPEWGGDSVKDSLINISYAEATKLTDEKRGEKGKELALLLKKCISDYNEWIKTNEGVLIRRNELTIQAYPLTELTIAQKDTDFKVYAIGSLRRWIIDNKNMPFIPDEKFETERGLNKKQLTQYRSSSKTALISIITIETFVFLGGAVLFLIWAWPQL